MHLCYLIVNFQLLIDIFKINFIIQQGPVEPMQVDVQPEGNDSQEDLVYAIENPTLVSTKAHRHQQ